MISRSRIGRCVAGSVRPAESMPNQPARSTSGNRWNLPERGGHSSSKVLLLIMPQVRREADTHGVDLIGVPTARAIKLLEKGGADGNAVLHLT